MNGKPMETNMFSTKPIQNKNFGYLIAGALATMIVASTSLCRGDTRSVENESCEAEYEQVILSQGKYSKDFGVEMLYAGVTSAVAGGVAFSLPAGGLPLAITSGAVGVGVAGTATTIALVNRHRVQQATVMLRLIREANAGTGLTLSQLAEQTGRSISGIAEYIAQANEKRTLCDAGLMTLDEVVKSLR